VSFIFMGIRILPGTALEKIALDEGLITHDQDLLEPVYYLSPKIDRDWLEETLTRAFKKIRRCVFPPDDLEPKVQFLHKLGHTGVLWDMLIPSEKRRGRR
ncbi:B12-binding domain-containing radical SAM protein, partial [Thermodesulfobacteriota bacterium]